MPSERCIRCHTDVKLTSTGFSHAEHAKRGECVMCHTTVGHNVTVAALKEAGVYTASTKAAFDTTKTAVVDAGKANLPGHVTMACSRCHDMAASKCSECHEPKHIDRGPDCTVCHTTGAKFVFTHPARTDCQSCHKPPRPSTLGRARAPTVTRRDQASASRSPTRHQPRVSRVTRAPPSTAPATARSATRTPAPTGPSRIPPRETAPRVTRAPQATSPARAHRAITIRAATGRTRIPRRATAPRATHAPLVTSPARALHVTATPGATGPSHTPARVELHVVPCSAGRTQERIVRVVPQERRQELEVLAPGSEVDVHVVPCETDRAPQALAPPVTASARAGGSRTPAPARTARRATGARAATMVVRARVATAPGRSGSSDTAAT